MSQYPWIEERARELREWFASNTEARPIEGFGPWLHETDLGLAVIARVEVYDPNASDAEDKCLQALHKTLEILGHGHRTYIRVRPVTEKFSCFDEGKLVTGFVRFTVMDEEGEWKYAEAPAGDEVRYVGLAELGK